MQAVLLTLAGDQADIKPAGFLGRDWFLRYKAACDSVGARFNAATKTQRLELRSVASACEALRQAGLVPRVAPDLVLAVEGVHARQREAADVVAKRVELARVQALGGRGPMPFQAEDAAWLAGRGSGVLTHKMGLGKTVMALLALPPADEAGVVVICPKSIKGVWQRHIPIWRSDYARVTVLSGRGSFRWPVKGEVVITNYDILPTAELDGRSWKVQVGEPTCPVLLVADEAHGLRNGKTNRARSFKALRRQGNAKAFLLTGTPLVNKPSDLWNVLEAADLAREAFGSWAAFGRLYNASADGWGGTSWGQPSPQVASLLRKVCRSRTFEEVAPDVPRMDVAERDAPIDSTTRQLCDAAVAALREAGIDLDGAVAYLGGGGRKPTGEKAQVAFEALSAARKALAVAKIPTMLEFVEEIEEQDEPLLVFSAHRAPVEALGKREGWAVIHGDVSAEDRSLIEQDFQAGRLRGVAATLTAGGFGLTLTKARYVLFVDKWWNDAVNDQARHRVHRIGQTQVQLATELVADHELDRRVAEILRMKAGWSRPVADAEFGAGSVSQEAPPAAALPAPEAIEAPEARMARELAVVAQAAAQAGRALCLRCGQEATEVDGLGRCRPCRDAVTRREPRTALERWALNGLMALSGLDPDRARQVNGMGFNKLDGDFGHKLAGRLPALTEKEWLAAVRMLRKYHRQIGPPPGADGADFDPA